MIANVFVWQPLHVATNLVRLFSTPSMTYSDFFGYGPYLQGWVWLTVYWGLFCVLLSIAALLLWPRGRELGFGKRISAARHRLHGAPALITVLVLLSFVGTGAWIFVNTKIWNRTESSNHRDRATADYEKNYKKYEYQRLPRIVDVRYAIDLRPETRDMIMTGDEIIRNETSAPTLDRNFDTEIEMAGLTPKVEDKRLNYRI
jgi:ABC-2 type transport system permease protein